MFVTSLIEDLGESLVLWKMSDSCKCDSSVSIAIFESDKALYQVQSNSAFWRDWISNFKMNYYSVQDFRIKESRFTGGKKSGGRNGSVINLKRNLFPAIFVSTTVFVTRIDPKRRSPRISKSRICISVDIQSREF